MAVTGCSPLLRLPSHLVAGVLAACSSWRGQMMYSTVALQDVQVQRSGDEASPSPVLTPASSAAQSQWTAVDGTPAEPPAAGSARAEPMPTSTPGPWLDPSLPKVLPTFITKIRPDPLPLLEGLKAVQAGHRKRWADGTVEAHIKLKVDPRKGDQVVRGAAVLPHGSGKKVRVAVFATGTDAERATQEGADVVGGEELIQQILDTKGGCIEFDKCIATPDMMKLLAKVGRILGPKGLMPNPKVGTLTTDVVGTLRQMRKGRVEYRIDRGAIVHVGFGKVSFPVDKLYANMGAVAQSLVDSKPAVIKGTGLAGYVQSVHLCSSQGKSVPIIPSSLVAAIGAARSVDVV